MATTPEHQPAADIELARDVSWSVLLAARHLPWKPVCLPQALAARWMLMRRDVESTLYLGVAKAVGVAKAEGLAAHAWLRVGDYVVTGKNGMHAYVVVSTFA